MPGHRTRESLGFSESGEEGRLPGKGQHPSAVVPNTIPILTNVDNSGGNRQNIEWTREVPVLARTLIRNDGEEEDVEGHRYAEEGDTDAVYNAFREGYRQHGDTYFKQS